MISEKCKDIQISISMSVGELLKKGCPGKTGSLFKP
jgi:hypothetical protein